MQLKMEGVNLEKQANGLLIKSEKPLYIFANRENYDFQFNTEFDNHYLNQKGIDTVILEEDGITVISTVEIINNKFFTNLSLLFDIDLDNLTMINLFKIAVESICSTSWDANALNKNELDNYVGNYYNTIFVACRDKSKKSLPFDVSLYFQVKDLIYRAITKNLYQLGYQKV